MARSFDPIQTINREVVKNDDVSLILNELGLHALGYALPGGVPLKYVPTVSGGKKEEAGAYGPNLNLSQGYLALRGEGGEEYRFRIDPILSVSGKNIIARRYVAKGSLQGTVKESWSQDDMEITIAGVLMGDDGADLNEQVQELQTLLASGESLAVENDLLNDGYGITRLVVESFQFPHTKGLENQAYSIKCYSDSSINILEEVQ